ncbi:MAG TPA: TolC family protein, partial [Turneriella sp.]|nr:TolC family protein [Turneriella sp.]
MKCLFFLCVPFFWVCRSAPVTLNDNSIESVYEKVLAQSAVKKKLLDIDIASKNFTIEELFILSLDRTEQLAIAAERTSAADAGVRKSYGAWLPRISMIAAQYAPLTPGFVVPGVRFSARQNIMTGLNEYTGVVGARLTRVSEEQNLRAEMAAHLLNIADAALQLKFTQTLRAQTAEIVKLSASNLAEIRRRISIG